MVKSKVLLTIAIVLKVIQIVFLFLLFLCVSGPQNIKILLKHAGIALNETQTHMLDPQDETEKSYDDKGEPLEDIDQETFSLAPNEGLMFAFKKVNTDEGFSMFISFNDRIINSLYGKLITPPPNAYLG